MSQRNETSFSLYVENTKHEKIFFFNWLHFFFSRLFLYHKELCYTSLFQHVKLYVAINRRRTIFPKTQICKFGRTKFDTHTVLLRDEVLISFKILPLQVLLSS